MNPSPAKTGTTGSSAPSIAVAESAGEVRRAVAEARRRGCTVGLVPTMGALHEGHLSLIRIARRECNFLVVSIFVNRPQFGPSEDFDRYPRTWSADLAACKAEGTDLVFAPAEAVIYPEGFRTWVHVEQLEDVLEGEFRPGHFRGVATVVLQLFNLVAPDRAYFGEKDFQQLLVIQQMVRDLQLSVEVRPCPLVREADGLAASSRNKYLGAEDRQKALALYRSLTLARELVRAGERDGNDIRQRMRDFIENTPGCALDYAELVDPGTLEVVTSLQGRVLAVVAARIGKVRLIDNMHLEP